MIPLKMYQNTTSGLLITFCGLDGCGKTTILNRLQGDLGQLRHMFVTKQPTDAVRKSEVFRTYMDQPDHEAFDYRSLSLLAASDRLQHVNKTILPKLEHGQIVLSDRYFYSCLANLRARGYEEDRWIYDVSRFVIKPDIAFFFDLPVEIAVNRVRKRREEKDRYIDMELQYKLRNEYINICKANGGILIPTDVPIEDSYKMVISEVERRLIR